MPLKKISSALAVIVLILATSVAIAQTSTATARPELKDEGFTILFPAGFSKPERQEQTIKSEAGPIKQVTYVSKSPEGIACVLAYSEMTGDILDPKAMMISGRDSLLQSLNAVIDSEKEVDMDGNPGMTLLYSAKEPKALYARTDLVVVGPRMYQLILIAPTAEGRQDARARECFDSFVVREIPDADAMATDTTMTDTMMTDTAMMDTAATDVEPDPTPQQ